MAELLKLKKGYYMQQQTSIMFLRNVSCIDHAYIDANGSIKGGSYHQEITVRGSIDSKEQVVVDFSTVKKQIKEILDDKETGFDHKLWIIEGLSKCECEPISEPLNSEENNYVRIITPIYTITVPKNAIKVIKGYSLLSLNQTSVIEEQMCSELTAGLNLANNCNNITVELSLNQNALSESNNLFTYFHGLKDSTSWGCNNIAHGHTSFVEIYDDCGFKLDEVEKMVASYLNSAMLIFKDNIKFKLDNMTIISYITPRGYFNLTFDNSKVKTIVMEKETTVENIVEHVCEKFEPVLSYYGVGKVFISEGLQKGALKEFNKYL